MRGLSEIAGAGWPIATTLAAVLVGERIRDHRRRAGVGRALHELRRPLQTLALGVGRRLAGGLEGQLELARAALADLERALDGGGTAPARPCPVSPRPLLEAAAARWQEACGRIEVAWDAGDPILLADPLRLAQALDNLIANASEHGRPPVALAGSVCANRLRIAVRDQGCRAERTVPRLRVSLLRQARTRRGHGLQVVSAVAAAHGGRFAIHRSPDGTVAILELPLDGAGATRVA